ncbi:hypothetical protein [Novacetimonas cocois]|nr:hypothetical protein [Novacetimonas cocois]
MKVFGKAFFKKLQGTLPFWTKGDTQKLSSLINGLFSDSLRA